MKSKTLGALLLITQPLTGAIYLVYDFTTLGKSSPNVTLGDLLGFILIFSVFVIAPVCAIRLIRFPKED